ncbi:MAG: OmpA family protein [Gammaproteobacteria bacterium]|nr:OmpA family protein [Gammaproteobacteria bacterium]
MKICLMVCSIFLIFSWPAKVAAKTHPLIKPFAGAKLTDEKYFDYFEGYFPLSELSRSDFAANQQRAVKGRFYFNRYKVANTSAVDIYRNYLSAFEKQGFKIEYTCAPAQCGRYVERYLEEYSALKDLTPILNDKSAYLVASLENDGHKLSILLAVSDSLDPVNFYQVVVEEYQPAFDKVTLDPVAYQQHLRKIAGKDAVKVSAKKDIEGAQDHPLISRYQGAALVDYAQFGYEEVAMPLVPAKAKKPNDVVSAKGEAQFFRYSTAEGVSLTEVVKSYQSAFSNQQFEILFQCAVSECGRHMESFIESDKVFKGINVNTFGDMPVYVVRHASEFGNTFVLVTFTDWKNYVDVYQIVVREQAVNADKVAINTDYLAKQINANGKVALYGIHFNHDSDTLTDDSIAPLAVIADFLKQNTDLSVYVVGHTDASGTEEYNSTLSLQRARAITEKLVKEFGVARSRLTPKGVGNLVPVASNKIDEGKQLNRRVELVEKL